MRQVFVFDFDGTLTHSDTLIAFIRHACGRWAMLWGFALCSPWIVLMLMHLYPNYKAKQRLFAHFFGGWEEARFDAACRDFARSHHHLLRQEGLRELGRALTEGAEVAIVRRIREVFPDRDNYHLTAFGDSRGDKEMLDYADQGYYKPFR